MRRARHGSGYGGICNPRHSKGRSDEAIQTFCGASGLLRFARNDGYIGLMTSNLFVYGTLMRGFDNPMTKLLARNAEFCGPARCQGRLYLVTWYPGMVLSDDPGDVVFGELFSLHS